MGIPVSQEVSYASSHYKLDTIDVVLYFESSSALSTSQASIRVFEKDQHDRPEKRVFPCYVCCLLPKRGTSWGCGQTTTNYLFGFGIVTGPELLNGVHRGDAERETINVFSSLRAWQTKHTGSR